nr:MAG TPA: hypothetical protein [Caudoviricetes sp.]
MRVFHALKRFRTVPAKHPLQKHLGLTPCQFFLFRHMPSHCFFCFRAVQFAVSDCCLGSEL